MRMGWSWTPDPREGPVQWRKEGKERVAGEGSKRLPVGGLTWACPAGQAVLKTLDFS